MVYIFFPDLKFPNASCRYTEASTHPSLVPNSMFLLAWLVPEVRGGRELAGGDQGKPGLLV